MKKLSALFLILSFVSITTASHAQNRRSAEAQTVRSLDSLACVYRTEQRRCESLAIRARWDGDEASRVGRLHYEKYQRLCRMYLKEEAEYELGVYHAFRRQATAAYSQSDKFRHRARKFEELAVGTANRARLARHGGDTDTVWYGFYETSHRSH